MTNGGPFNKLTIEIFNLQNDWEYANSQSD